MNTTLNTHSDKTPTVNWKGWVAPVLLTTAMIAVSGVALSWRNARDRAIHAANQAAVLAQSPVDPGTSLDGKPAPNFSLVNQNGQQMSLSQFRGKVVVLAFIDSECTTICPLTSNAMLDAVKMLSPADRQRVQLVAVNANPTATTLSDVMAYTKDHGLSNKWDFFTGSKAQLSTVWKKYDIYSQIVKGQIDHTPALYVINGKGQEQMLYLSTMQYGTENLQSSELAHEVVKLLPDSTSTLPALSYNASTVTDHQPLSLPVYGSTNGAKVAVGAGKARVLVFLASWQSGIRQELLALNKFAEEPGHPPVVAIDVGPTEPDKAAMGQILKTLPKLSFPIAYDASGKVSDAYHVQNLSWITLTSQNAKILWHHDGFLPLAQLKAQVGKYWIPSKK